MSQRMLAPRTICSFLMCISLYVPTAYADSGSLEQSQADCAESSFDTMDLGNDVGVIVDVNRDAFVTSDFGVDRLDSSLLGPFRSIGRSTEASLRQIGEQLDTLRELQDDNSVIRFEVMLPDYEYITNPPYHLPLIGYEYLTYLQQEGIDGQIAFYAESAKIQRLNWQDDTCQDFKHFTEDEILQLKEAQAFIGNCFVVEAYKRLPVVREVFSYRIFDEDIESMRSINPGYRKIRRLSFESEFPNNPVIGIFLNEINGFPGLVQFRFYVGDLGMGSRVDVYEYAQGAKSYKLIEGGKDVTPDGFLEILLRPTCSGALVLVGERDARVQNMAGERTEYE